jgi:L-lactate dehydrogenase complex protein LldE
MNNQPRVAFFVTCIVDQLMPEVGTASVRLLQRAGYAVDFPPEQTCCGQPFINSGFHEETIRLAKRTIEVFEDHEAVVLPNGSCTSMIRLEYSHLFTDQPGWLEAAQKLASKTYELSEFLVHKADWQPAPTKDTPIVTYHDSCHSNRTIHVSNEPRKLLSAAGCSIIEMQEADRCCGFGGLFSLRVPEVSNAMTAEKLTQAKETGAEIMVTIDPGCMMNMRGHPLAEGIRVEHLATVLEEVTR